MAGSGRCSAEHDVCVWCHTDLGQGRAAGRAPNAGRCRRSTAGCLVVVYATKVRSRTKYSSGPPVLRVLGAWPRASLRQAKVDLPQTCGAAAGNFRSVFVGNAVGGRVRRGTRGVGDGLRGRRALFAGRWGSATSPRPYSIFTAVSLAELGGAWRSLAMSGMRSAMAQSRPLAPDGRAKRCARAARLTNPKRLTFAPFERTTLLPPFSCPDGRGKRYAVHATTPPLSIPTMDYYQAMPDLPSMLMQELYQQLLPLDGLGMGLHGHGLPTGVQTTTTPTLTLTPTTLRCFATSADLLSALDDEQPSYHNEAGFVPPIVQTSASSYMNLVDAKAWQGGTMSVTTMPMGASAANSGASQQDQPAEPAEAITVSQPLPSASPPLATTPPRRNVGGRRPNKSKGISPEEEERRQVRRDRNKAAAARCRKRRMDHTNSLLKETDGLEQKKNGLQLEIRNLNRELDELSYILEKHVCRHPRPDTTVNQVSRPEPSVSPPDIKPQVFEVKQERPDLDLEPPMKRPMLSMPQPQPQPLPQHAMPAPAPAPAPKPSRPTSLPVSSHTMLRSSVSEIAGISITTPSTGIPLNFDSLMDGGTGLTPVSGPLVPSCSSQQRNQNCVDLSSPDSNISNKLVSL